MVIAHCIMRKRSLYSAQVSPVVAPTPDRMRLQHGLKRSFDVLGAASALVLLSPLIAVVALLVRVRLGSPVIFRQVRPGIQARPFTMFKFRSMADAYDGRGRLLPDAERLTPFGRWLRRTSLDELPELVNVLRGDMSLVGPRPLIMEYVERYTPDQSRRLDVRPGVTGLAQVSGRNALSWEERFELDVEYVDRWSLWLDVTILARTIATVLRRDGISADGHATMPEFLGSTRRTHGVSHDLGR